MARASYTRNRGHIANRKRNAGGRARRRIWRKKPTARNQQKQIAGNAKQIDRIYRHIKSQRLYTDYQMIKQHLVLPGAAGGQYLLPLCDPSDWANPVLRQDTNVQASQRTFVLRMQLNLKSQMLATAYSTTVVPVATYWSVFILRPRSTQAVNNPTAFLTTPDDYIENTLNEGNRIRLNSGKWKVLASSYFTLNSTPLWKSYKNWQWNVKLNMVLNGQESQEQNWRQCTPRDVPYFHRYYMWVVPYRADPGATGFALDTDALYTCLNYA